MRMNGEVRKIANNMKDRAKLINVRRTEWLSYMLEMEGSRPPKRILLTTMIANTGEDRSKILKRT